MLWHGWLKKLGRFSKRWRRRYFVFVAVAGGRKELRHYGAWAALGRLCAALPTYLTVCVWRPVDACRDVTTLLLSTPKGVISLADAVGICCFLPPTHAGGKKVVILLLTMVDGG